MVPYHVIGQHISEVTIERAILIIAIGSSAIAFLVHASAAMGSAYLNPVSGIWLALGRDLHDGVFYRDLIGDLGYGGTRYFPLFFVVIALFMRAGVDPVIAGWIASAVAGTALATGMYRIARALGCPSLHAILFACAAVAPYFVQQTLFEVRADVFAAGLNLWALSFLVPEWGRGRVGRASLWLSALFFTLAIAAKVTSAAIPIAAVAAALAAGRRKLGAGLLIRFIVAVAIFALVVHWASDGRALESWRACMFAGTGPGELLGMLLAGEFLRPTRYSRLLIALLVVAIAALTAAFVAARRDASPDARRSLWLPAGVFLASSLSSAVALSSPGTVPSNQMVEWIAIVLFVLVFVACTQPRLTRGLTLVAALLVLWMSAQDVASARKLWRVRPDAAEAVERSRLVERVAAAPGPVLAESAVWPVLARREIYLLDPFAIRVVMQSRKDIERDLLEKIERRMFPLMIFQFDPASPETRGYYEHVSFGRPITEKILENYRLDSRPVSEAFVYVPRQR